MSKVRQLHGRAFIDGRIRLGQTIMIDDDRIASVRPGVPSELPQTGEDDLIVPAFVDLHVHGGGGADFMDGTPEAVEAVLQFHAHHGTGALAATTLSAETEQIDTALHAIAAVRSEGSRDRAMIAGIHLEGPYLSVARCGAQKPGTLRAANAEELSDWLAIVPGAPFLMTIAPEVEQAMDLIRFLSDRVVFSIGHTDTDYETTLAALAAGAQHFTHLFNAMPPLHHRQPGPVGAALVSPEATVELIADGVHLHPALLHMAAALLPERAVLVTDAIRAAGMPPGDYTLLDRPVTIRDGAARLPDGTIAGSVLTMIDAVRNMVELAGVPIETVLPMATSNPARVLRLGQRTGAIAPGLIADLVVLSPRLEIRRVILAGREIPIS